MQAVVLYESLTGHTRRVAELIGGAVAQSGVEVSVRPITAIDYGELADAEVVFIGSWTDGLILFGQRPGRAGRLRKMPVIDRKLTAIFCTYAVAPKKTLDRLAAIVEEKGAKVVARHAFKRNRLEDGVDDFVREALAAVPAAERAAP